MLRALAAALLASAFACAQAQDFAAGGVRFHFASAQETRKALAADDDWMATIGPFHRAVTVGHPVSRAEFAAELQRAARDCGEGDVRRWRAAAETVAPAFAQLRMALPSPVTIACTTGMDAAGAPYTRGASIFMPPGSDEPRDAFVFAHELFHVFSRAHPQVATRLYALIGFSEAPPLAWPAEWADARISNPDAPLDRHTIAIESDGQPCTVMPVLVARRTALQPGESFFHVMDVRLLAVERAADGRSSVPLRRDGQLVWFDANRTPSYLRQLGGNTGYVIHPEETTADNIALLVTNTPARNPRLVERMREVLLSKAPAP